MILDRHGYPFGNAVIPDFNIKLTSVEISAKPRKIGSFTSGPARDLRSLMGGDHDLAPSVIDRMAELLYSDYRDVAEVVAKLPEDLIPQDVKDIALGNILKLIPQKHWPCSWDARHDFWEKSVLGVISRVIESRALKSM